MKYEKVVSGDIVRVKRPVWRTACCDCDLVHDFTFFVRGRKIFIRVIRNNRATAAKRRKKQHVASRR